MRDLGALIRYKKWMLDDQRRVLAEIEQMERRLHSDLAQLAADLQHEQDVAAADPQAGYKFAEYTAAVARRREKIQQSIAAVQDKARAARDEVAAAFEELKRYELTQAQRDKERAAELARREQTVLDEVALNSHRRRAAKTDAS